MRLTLAAALILLPATAHAHAGGLPVTPLEFWHHWSLDPLVVVPLLTLHILYGRGVSALWRNAGRRGIRPGHVACFAAGELVLVVALVSPLDALGETLLTAHMVQHGLLVAVAPPLLLAGRPGTALAWALPRAWRRAGWALSRPLAALARPLPATLLHGLALWAWHAPQLYEAALADPVLHWLEHVSFLATGLLLWRAVQTDRRGGAALAAMLVTLVHSGMLAGLITLAPRPLYPWYAGLAELWGLTALDDQALAGVLMWVPMGLVYVAAGVTVAARLARGLDMPEPAPALVVGRGGGGGAG